MYSSFSAYIYFIYLRCMYLSPHKWIARYWFLPVEYADKISVVERKTKSEDEVNFAGLIM